MENYDNIVKITEDEYEGITTIEQKATIKISNLIKHKEQLEASIVAFNEEILRIEANILYLQNL